MVRALKCFLLEDPPRLGKADRRDHAHGRHGKGSASSPSHCHGSKFQPKDRDKRGGDDHSDWPLQRQQNISKVSCTRTHTDRFRTWELKLALDELRGSIRGTQTNGMPMRSTVSPRLPWEAFVRVRGFQSVHYRCRRTPMRPLHTVTLTSLIISAR